MTENLTLVQQYLQRQVREEDTQWQEFRKQCGERLQAIGIPTFSKADAHLNELLAGAVSESSNLDEAEPRNESITLLMKIDAYQIHVHNDTICDENRRSLTRLPSGVIFGSLAQACEEMPERVWKHLGRLSAESDEPMAHLAGIIAAEGVFIYVPEGVEVDKPIIIESTYSESARTLHGVRNLLIAEKGSKTILFSCHNLNSSNPMLVDEVTEIILEEGAEIDATLFQEGQGQASLITHRFVHLEESSKATMHCLVPNAEYAQNLISAKLDGKHAYCEINGLAIANGKQHVGLETAIEHAKPNCVSSQLYKTIVDDRGRVKFFGRIDVDKDAQKTEAYQRNSNILLSRQGKVQTKPQLIINADDVKCSHGATVGQIDPEARFYMQSRGIPVHMAELLLMKGFAFDVINTIPHEEVRKKMQEFVESRLERLN